MAKQLPKPWRWRAAGLPPAKHQVWLCRALIEGSGGKRCGRVALYKVGADGYCKYHKSLAWERRVRHLVKVIDPKAIAKEVLFDEIDRSLRGQDSKRALEKTRRQKA
jgi:hypothetical protein